MDKDTLKEILQTDSLMLSVAEIEAILDEELEKPPEEMDTDLIERCALAIESLKNNNRPFTKRKSLYKTIVVIAAAILLLFAGIMSVGAFREPIVNFIAEKQVIIEEILTGTTSPSKEKGHTAKPNKKPDSSKKPKPYNNAAVKKPSQKDKQTTEEAEQTTTVADEETTEASDNQNEEAPEETTFEEETTSCEELPTDENAEDEPGKDDITSEPEISETQLSTASLNFESEE